MKLIYSLPLLSIAILEQEMEFLAIYTGERWGVTDHFSAKHFSNFWHGKGTFYLCLAL